eukprot:4964383-Pleurochrysis_carterae.AAC.2
MPNKGILDAQRCLKLPVIVFDIGRANSECPELVPARAATRIRGRSYLAIPPLAIARSDRAFKDARSGPRTPYLACTSYSDSHGSYLERPSRGGRENDYLHLIPTVIGQGSSAGAGAGRTCAAALKRGRGQAESAMRAR